MQPLRPAFALDQTQRTRADGGDYEDRQQILCPDFARKDNRPGADCIQRRYDNRRWDAVIAPCEQVQQPDRDHVQQRNEAGRKDRIAAEPVGKGHDVHGQRRITDADR